MQITALTELDAVNSIIGTIGEAPINNLEELTDVDAINALRILRSISRQEQARGWTFNKMPHFLLNPNMDTKRIPWNSNYLYVKENHGLKLVRQGDYVKDLFNNTMTFEQPLDVEIVLALDFENLPEQMRNYILAKACFVFQSSYFGDDSLTKITQQEIAEAWQQLMEFEVDNNNISMLEHTDVYRLRKR